MDNVRGLSLIAAIKYIQQNFEEEGLNRIIEQLEGDDRETVTKDKIKAMSWYPKKTFSNLMKITEKTYGKGDCNICRRIGRFDAEKTFSGLYRAFIEFGNPHSVIRKAPLAWRTLNDTGDLEISKLSDKYVKGKISGVNEPDKCICYNLSGYFERVLEMSGAKNVEMKEIKCRCEGDEYCEYEIKWE